VLWFIERQKFQFFYGPLHKVYHVPKTVLQLNTIEVVMSYALFLTHQTHLIKIYPYMQDINFKAHLLNLQPILYHAT